MSLSVILAIVAGVIALLALLDVGAPLQLLAVALVVLAVAVAV